MAQEPVNRGAPLLWADLGALPARGGFTTRRGGVSTGPLASLNLARRPGGTDAELAENWERVARALGRSARDVALLDQVHGARVLVVGRGSGPLATHGEADAMVCAVPGVVLAVRTADCAPVLFAAPGGVAVAHSGWRGTVAGVVPAALAALLEATGAAPGQVVAALGPHIKAPAYEVGDAVIGELVAGGIPREVVSRPGTRGRPHADIEAAIRWQLRQAGVADLQVVGGCTTATDDLWSHRRDGPPAGRQAGVVVLL